MSSNIIKKYKPNPFTFSKKKICKWNPRETFTTIYGFPGCGKTTEAAKLSKYMNVLILDFDRGGAIGKDAIVEKVRGVEHLYDMISSIRFKQFDIIILDSVDLMEDMIDAYTRDIFDTAYTGQIQWGKDWIFGRTRTIDVINILGRTGAHIIMIGHAVEKEKKDGDKKYTEKAPALREKIFNLIGGSCVATLYMRAMGDKRYIFSKLARSFYAKDRTGMFPDGLVVTPGGEQLTKVYIDGFNNYK